MLNHAGPLLRKAKVLVSILENWFVREGHFGNKATWQGSDHLGRLSRTSDKGAKKLRGQELLYSMAIFLLFKRREKQLNNM